MVFVPNVTRRYYNSVQYNDGKAAYLSEIFVLCFLILIYIYFNYFATTKYF
jgi:hypothetical protein